MSHRHHWLLDPEITFLNHGSFGACPKPVLDHQSALRAELEREPLRFFLDAYGPQLDQARLAAAAFVGADPDGFVFVRNATQGVNAVLQSLRFEPGDELLTTDHAYGACRNALDFVARRWGARVVTAQLPFPLSDPAEISAALLGAVTPRTRLALLDHVTSPTGLVLPIAEMVAALEGRGVTTLVDGAHGPGMVELRLDELGAAFYTGNFHKWVCAPKGAAFLWAREDHREAIHPTSISHGFSHQRDGRSALHEEFDWTGTDDPSPWLCVPAAIDFLAGLLPGGWPALRQRNRALALAARDHLAAALGIDAPAPDVMIGSLAALPLPGDHPAVPVFDEDPLQVALFARHQIEVPVMPWSVGPRLLRISAHAYNEQQDYLDLSAALRSELG